MTIDIQIVSAQCDGGIFATVLSQELPSHSLCRIYPSNATQGGYIVEATPRGWRSRSQTFYKSYGEAVAAGEAWVKRQVRAARKGAA